ncbi:MAG: putative membrane protein [Parcubacteria group bacterium Gr01-1014_107]|nr:MAG: putative membrane protein [Parcubacteria group bacterium Gr01-1014_107]
MSVKLPILRAADYQYFLKLKKAIVFCLLIFIYGILVGVLISKIIPELSETILKTLREVSQKTKELNDYQLLLAIFLNNAVKIFFAIVLGVFFGLAPWLFLFVNGYLVGFLALITYHSIGLSTFWLGVLPHGIFELPGVILGSSAGLFLGETFFRKIFLKQKITMRKEISEALAFFGRVIVPLLFIAAFVEVFITKSLLS